MPCMMKGNSKCSQNAALANIEIGMRSSLNLLIMGERCIHLFNLKQFCATGTMTGKGFFIFYGNAKCEPAQ